MKQKNSFSGKLGFILAAAGSAVGLGNLWRFPYLAAKYGGGTFLLIYLVLAVTFGFALLVTEISIGRKTGKSALYAYKSLDKKWGFVGILSCVVPIIILPYYSVIGGWVVKYSWVYLSGKKINESNAESYFTGFISSSVEPIIWLAIFVIATMIIILMGVNKGIENMSKILMPVLVLLSIVVAVFVVTRDGAGAGIEYYLKPDFSKLSAKTFLAAAGQLFYSMSLAMGIMITYGSYLPKDNDIESSVRNIELFDTIIAFLAGLMIVPAVFIFTNGSEEMLAKGPTLMFIILPQVFSTMAGGKIIGAAFFILVFFAALTSAISLMETIVSIFADKTGKSRKFLTVCITVYTIIMAIPSSLGFGVWECINLGGKSILDMFDFVSNSIIMPIVALLTCIFIGYVVKPKAVTEEVMKSTKKFKSEKLYIVIIKYIAPILLVLILISSILDACGIITL